MAEAEKILRKVAKYNGKLFPESLLRDLNGAITQTDEGVAKIVDSTISNGTANVGVAKTVDPTDYISIVEEDVAKTVNSTVNDGTAHEGVATTIRLTGSNGGTAGGVAKIGVAHEGVAKTVHSTGSSGSVDLGVATAVSQKYDGKSRGMFREFLRMFTYRVLLVRNSILFFNW